MKGLWMIPVLVLIMLVSLACGGRKSSTGEQRQPLEILTQTLAEPTSASEPPSGTLEPVATKTVAVEVELVGAAPVGYSLSESEVSPEYVNVSGPESLVNLVDAAAADVNLTGIRVSLEQTLTLTARDARGSDINGVDLEPNTAEVSLTIVQQQFSMVCIVNPSVTGNVASGYDITSIEAQPAYVTLSGPLEVLESIDVLTTEDVAVDGAQSDVVKSVRLRVPKGAHVADGEEVLVRVRVAPARY
jgi:YbbR domain-containing protein